MENSRPEIDDIVQEVKTYLNNSAELYKMKATAKGAEIASGAVIHIVIGVLIVMLLLFASLALAYLIADYFNEMYLGFLSVALIYGLLALIVYMGRDRWLKNSLVNGIIKSVYSN
jgi:hypothetical protein